MPLNLPRAFLLSIRFKIILPEKTCLKIWQIWVPLSLKKFLDNVADVKTF